MPPKVILSTRAVSLLERGFPSKKCKMLLGAAFENKGERTHVDCTIFAHDHTDKTPKNTAVYDKHQPFFCETLLR
ncbi:Uncharacterised protein [BD1-7 clade bacterium]|uniref:Uncharacterized protein n=1 Tax=BD1-7 clade bacterium TaxID=2029982 RepID=A0A5S9N5D5_9GAMM|nr:Uncharacterised protein [BD1-7 clade bacterium]